MTTRWIVEFTHGQFAIADSDASGEPGDLESETAGRNLVVVSDDQTEVSILTARYGRFAKVFIDVFDSVPSQDYSNWDHVVECNLNVPSGKIQLWTTAGSTVFSAATRESEDAEISVPPAVYRVRILFANLAVMHKRLAETGHEHSRLYYGDSTIPSDEGLDAIDNYHLMLWPVALSGIKILKQYQEAI